MKKLWLTIMSAMTLLHATCLYAQENFSATGGTATGNGGNVSFTAGQVAYTSNTDNSGTVIQGIQQPFEIFVITGTNEAGLTLEVAVYPNPTSDFLKLNIADYNYQRLTYRLFDLNGSLLMIGTITEKQTDIPTGDLAPASYYLKISDDHTEIMTFKIIKN